MSRQRFLNLIHLRFSLLVIPLLILLKIDRSEGKDIWCCRGWSDDMSKPGQVETHECQYNNLCRGSSICTDSTNKDCVTNWGCPDSDGIRPNKTDDDCTKPEAGKECYCDTPWCNCPKELRKKEMPRNQDKLTCCTGLFTDAPEKLGKQKCSLLSAYCLGVSTANNVTNLNCGFEDNARYRGNCYGFSSPEKYGRVSGLCRCTTDYCNCPSGGGKMSGILNTQAALIFSFSFCSARKLVF